MTKTPTSKRVLITGAAGFIGSNLSRSLLAKGYSLIGIDNLSRGCKRNIKPLLHNKDFNFIQGDIRDRKTVDRLMRGVNFVIHLAAYKIPRYGNVMDTLITNACGTKNVLESAHRQNAKVLFASTSDVYGKSSELPFQENGDLIFGHSRIKRWAYAASKLFNEHLCFAYEEKYRLKVCVLRIFGSYGPQQNLTWRGGPQSVFIAKALKNEIMEIHGNGKQVRSFAYIDDTVEGIIRAMESKKAIGEIINIGNNKEITILDLAKLIWKMVRKNQKAKIKFIPYSRFSEQYEDVIKRVPDIEKAKKILGFVAKTGLKEGLSMTIEWQKSLMQ
jgi:UDP-glucose 4-epimerase